MRALTGQPATVEALKERSTRMRVQIDRTGAGAWVDLSSYQSLDWIDSVEYEDNGDQPVGEATVRLRREWHDLSLSPLMAQSKLNAGGTLVWPKRQIKIEVAVMPEGISAGASDWMEVFRGRIDKIDWQRTPIELRCRDKGGDLQDGWVETQAVYGTAGGRALESVIQDILTDASTNGWIPAAVTLYSATGTAGTPFAPADSPGFLVLEYKQGREPVMDAVQKLARLIGWECRYRWNTDTAAFQLVLYEPARAVRARGTITVAGAPVAAETFAINGIPYTARAAGAGADEFNIGATTATTATNIAAMLNAGTGAAGLNAWVVGSTVIVEWQAAGVAGDAITFTEAMTNVTMDGAGTLGGTRAGADAVVNHTFGPSGYYDVEQLSMDVSDVRNAFSGTFTTPAGEHTTVTRRNNDSITKYNRRPFLLTEDAASQIDTVSEMIDLLDAADNDLSEPDEVQAVLVPFFPWGEAGDYYTFSANGRHYDTNQSLAAVSLRHVLTPDQARTLIAARGKPSLGPTRWLEAEGRPGVGPPPDIYADEAAQNPAATAGVGTVIVVYDDPRTQTPPIEDWAYTECHVSTSSGFTPDSTTLVARGRVTRFEIGDLVPGTTYYVKLKIIDDRGNVAATSTQVSVATERVGPYHENRDGQQDQLLRNNDLNIWTKGSTIVPDAWSMVTGTWNTDIVRGTTDPATGNYHIDFSVVSGGMQPVIESAFIPIAGGTADTAEILQAAILAKHSGGSANSRVGLDVRFYDASLAFLSAVTQQFTPTSAYVTYQTPAMTAPTTARFCKVRLTGTYSAGVTYTLRIDRASLLRAYAFGHAGYNAGPNNPFSTTDAVLEFNDAFTDDIGVTYIAGALDKDQIEVIYPGVYVPSVYAVSVDNTITNHKLELQIQIDTGGGYSTVAAINGTSRPAAVTEICWLTCIGPPVFLEKGDRMRVLYNTRLADNATRDVQCLNISLRQITRGDQ